MERIEKINGYVYLIEGDFGIETRYNLGKDPDDPMWEEQKKKKQNKKEVK